MGTTTSGEFYEVVARSDGMTKENGSPNYHFTNGTCRSGTMDWTLPLQGNRFTGKRGLLVGLVVLGAGAMVESVRSRRRTAVTKLRIVRTAHDFGREIAHAAVSRRPPNAL